MSVTIFFCYAHEDEALLNKLKSHLRPLQRQGLIDVWHDRDISAGTLQALPTDAKPVRSALWHSVDEAFFDVAEGIRTVVVQLGTKPVSPSEVLPSQVSKGESEAVSLILTLTGHTYSVDSVAISPDGQTLASGSGDQTIKIWGMKEMNRQ
jgi:WD40 repeat protein